MIARQLSPYFCSVVTSNLTAKLGNGLKYRTKITCYVDTMVLPIQPLSKAAPLGTPSRRWSNTSTSASWN